ncbi:MAG: hypothetical protein R2851_14255 [Caldilineaceae bacterium]
MTASPYTPAYYAKAFALFVPDAAAFLLADSRDARWPPSSSSSWATRPEYLWGASSNDERNRMPNHAAMSRHPVGPTPGATRYDLWGIPDEVGQLATAMQGDAVGVPAEELPVDVQHLPDGELWGVFRFKQGFGGRALRTVGAWDLPLHPLGYRAYTAGLTALDARRHPRGRRRHWRSGPVWAAPTCCRRTCAVWTAPAAWSTALAALPESHVLQSWEWGDVMARTEWQAHRYTVTGRRSTVCRVSVAGAGCPAICRCRSAMCPKARWSTGRTRRWSRSCCQRAADRAGPARGCVGAQAGAGVA